MPKIKPWCWPPNYTYDRVMYIPTRPANLLEYQEEMIDAQGNHYWKTVDSTAVRGFASIKDLLEEMKDFYESKSCRKDKMI
jgi:hypothetical protein